MSANIEPTKSDRPDAGENDGAAPYHGDPPSATAGAVSPAPAGRRIGNDGRYVLGSRLGGGGMGEVFLAYDTRLNNQLVAVKMPHREADQLDLNNFKEEVHKMVALKGTRNILQVTDQGYDQATRKPFLVMDYAKGGTLATALGGRPQSQWLAAELMEALAVAVQAIHDIESNPENKLIHRI